MSDKKIIFGDEMIENQLKENSEKLNISVEELVDRYIRRGLYTDDYYKQPKLSKEKLKEIFKIDDDVNMEENNSRKKGNMDSIIGIYDYSKE
ncbi:hypothetical protein [Methanobrevibacter sp.]|uniref:hypothetical protein n=1 Tax=Methanobrevibacter sp. TaxID=66852 RepID=UPI00388D0605